MKTILKAVSIRDFKKLEKIDLAFNGNSYFLMGNNGAGKSSLIQAIRIALNLEETADNLVTEGKDKGSISLDFERDGVTYNVLVKLKETKDGITFDVTNKDGGAKLKSPKTFLTAAAGPYVDIFEVLKNQDTAAGRKANEEFFLKLANLSPDIIKKFADDIAAKENTRTVVGRNRDIAAGYVAKMRDEVNPEKYNEKKDLKPLYDANQEYLNKHKLNAAENARAIEAKYALFDKSDLIKERSDLLVLDSKLMEIKGSKSRGEDMAQSLNNEKKENLARIAAMQARNEQIDADLKDIDSKIEDLNKKADALLASVTRGLGEVDELLATIDAKNKAIKEEKQQAILDEVKRVGEHNLDVEAKAKAILDAAVKEMTDWNTAVDNANQYRMKVEEAENLEKEWFALQQSVVDLRTERRNYIMTGVFPIPGMKYDEDKGQVTYNDLILSDKLMSTGNIIRLGVALNAAYNPNGVNMLAIPNASLMDDANLNEAINELKEHDMFGLFEIVERDGDGELHIEVI